MTGLVNLLSGISELEQLILAPSGALQYRYCAVRHGDVQCSFFTLCEVGEMYKRPFAEAIAPLVAAGWTFQTRELADRPPWLVDYLNPPGSPPVEGRLLYGAEWQLEKFKKLTGDQDGIAEEYKYRAPGTTSEEPEAAEPLSVLDTRDELFEAVQASTDFVEKVLMLSTSHMPSGEPEFGDIRYVEHEYGWIVFVAADDDEEEKWPEWLRPILRLANQLEASHINFDTDAMQLPGLQLYDW